MWSQERAAKWRTPDGLMDGLTTNGVLVMHPAGGFSEDSAPGVWREISVCGNVYSLRDSRSAQQRGKLVGGLLHAHPPPSSLPGPSPDLLPSDTREPQQAPSGGHAPLAPQRGPDHGPQNIAHILLEVRGVACGRADINTAVPSDFRDAGS